jgi:serine/threonine protein kinase
LDVIVFVLVHPQDPRHFSFRSGRVLGQGTYGVVTEAMNELTGEMVALKRIELRHHPSAMLALQQAQSEIDLLRRMRHPNVVGIKGSFQAGGAFYVVMELVSGRSIADLLIDLGPFHELVIKRFTKQILEGLKYCHKNGCLHRDIVSARSPPFAALIKTHCPTLIISLLFLSHSCRAERQEHSVDRGGQRAHLRFRWRKAASFRRR